MSVCVCLVLIWVFSEHVKSVKRHSATVNYGDSTNKLCGG